MEKQRVLEEERIKAEQKERKQQQIMAEQALAELEERRKQTTDYYEKVRRDIPEIETDPLPMAIQMSRYPSMESV